MNELINKVLQWGVDKEIVGPLGKGTLQAQADKMFEEAIETRDAAIIHEYEVSIHGKPYVESELELMDGIGDLVVTAILLAEMKGWTLEQCVRTAYEEIANRTGKMVDGTFVKEN